MMSKLKNKGKIEHDSFDRVHKLSIKLLGDGVELAYIINHIAYYNGTKHVSYIATITHFSYKILPKKYQNINIERVILLKNSSPIVQYLGNLSTFNICRELLIKFLMHNSL